MNILRYQDWMRPQVIEMFAQEYGIDPVQFERQFIEFYESPFQKDHCVRIVAEENGKVGGFQSFFYWPLAHEGKTIRAFQSGNSLVHPDFRGKGLFAKMLDWIHLPENNIALDLLIGFPVEASYNSFIRNKWKNPFNLQWYIKPMRPVSSLFSSPAGKLSKKFGPRTPKRITLSPDTFFVEQQIEFDKYRFQFQQGHYNRFEYSESANHVLFEFKIQTRKKYIKELIIGKICPTSTDKAFIQRAFKSFIKEINRTTAVAFVSIAINDHSEQQQLIIEELGFKKIDRKIYFIAKGPLAEQISDWSNWWMGRADIDTW